MTCANCKFNDGLCYTSLPAKYKCELTNEFHPGHYKCDRFESSENIQPTTKEYNCPDCAVAVKTCVGCDRYESSKINNKKDVKPIDNLQSKDYTITYNEVKKSSSCDYCSNNPKNGGSGICNCTIPYFEGTYFNIT